jgi:hypothetical protein
VHDARVACFPSARTEERAICYVTHKFNILAVCEFRVSCSGQFPEHGSGLTGCAKRFVKKEMWLAALLALFCNCQETEFLILCD